MKLVTASVFRQKEKKGTKRNNARALMNPIGNSNTTGILFVTQQNSEAFFADFYVFAFH